MAITIEAVYENGILKPVHPLAMVAEGTRCWVTLHAEVEDDRIEKTYGLLGWTGDAEMVRRVALDPDFDRPGA